MEKFPSRLKTIYWLGVITLLPVALKSFIWLQVIHGVASSAIDGSGHYATAQIYAREIFPDTFGWTNAYFAGMPLPNFYPPLFFWIVSFLHHTHLFAFATAFKLLIALPLLLMPVAFWCVAYRLSGNNQLIAFGAAIASATLYSVGEIFQPNTGLDMSSTLLDGFYTQPFGFVLLLCWMLFYLSPRHNVRQFTSSTVLLALTVLANFFNAITAIVFIFAVLLCDIVSWTRSSDLEEHRKLRRRKGIPQLAALYVILDVMDALVAQLAVAKARHRVIFIEALDGPRRRLDVPFDQRRSKGSGDFMCKDRLAGAWFALDQQRPAELDRRIDRNFQVVGRDIVGSAFETHGFALWGGEARCKLGLVRSRRGPLPGPQAGRTDRDSGAATAARQNRAPVRSPARPFPRR